MRKTILIMLLAMASNSVAAEWVAAGRNDYASYYADSSNTSQTGELVKMWLLYDHTTAQVREVNGKRFMSQKIQVEYNCKDKQRRELYSAWYSGQKGNGDIVYTFNLPGYWAPVMAGSLGEIRWKLACEKQPSLAQNEVRG